MPTALGRGKVRLLGAATVAALAGALALAFSVFAPRILFRGDAGTGLPWLQRRASVIRGEFARVLNALDRRRDEVSARLPIPEDQDSFALLEELDGDPATEGLALVDANGRLLEWAGNIMDPGEFLPVAPVKFLSSQTAAFVVRRRASVYLVLPQAISPAETLIHFRLIAFLPPLRSSLLKEFNFLPPSLSRSLEIQYQDFRDNVDGYEKIFTRHQDEFVGRAGESGGPQTLFFPLRNTAGRIVATISLASPGAAPRAAALREGLRLAAVGLGLVALACLLAVTLSRPGIVGGRVGGAVLSVAILAAIRALALYLSRLEPLRGWAIFSPARAGFATVGNLTGSPADILLTACALAAAVAIAARAARRRDRDEARRPGIVASIATQVVAFAFAAALFAGFELVVGRLSTNSNVNLLRFSFSGSFIVLHAALLILLGTVMGAAYLAIRAAARASRSLPVTIGLAAAACAGLVLASRGMDGSVAALVAACGLIAALLALGFRPERLRRRETAVVLFLGAMAFLSQALERGLDVRVSDLSEGLLQTTVRGQETWAAFLIDQSCPEIDRRGREIAAFLKRPRAADFANSLWSSTPLARFNWYSSLEVLAAGGEVRSRFSLNVPQAEEEPGELPPSDRWSIVERTIALPGEEKDLLVAYKDWRENGAVLGRIVLRLSLDPEQLPFLYSANPYFELIRRRPLPSLDQFDLGFAVYGPDGRFLHNPMRIDAPLPTAVFAALSGGNDAAWSEFSDAGRRYRAFYVRDRGRTHVFFTPLRNTRARTAAFLRLCFLDAAWLIAAALVVTAVARRRSRLTLLRSFSNRLYGAFIAAALVPLLLFTVFTRDLVDRMFAGRYVREAAARADYARSLLADFLELRQTPEGTPAPIQDIAFWISATLDTDVNIYREGRLLASSRREFFDQGLLSEMMDGRTYHRITHGGTPFVDSLARIGGYGFHTLTVPFQDAGGTLFVSLPFPLQREEAAAATSELVEFLMLLAVLGAALVLVFARTVRSMFIVPVRKLLAGTREVSLGNLEVSLDHRSRDEMMTLVQGFNAMTRSLKTQQQELAEMSKTLAWADMARKVAHEIKNPLTPIQLAAEHLLTVYEDKRGDFEKTLRESLSYIITEVEALRRIAQDFMELAREPARRSEDFDLRAVLEEMVQPFARLLADRIKFDLAAGGAEAAPGGFRMRGDPSKLRTAFRNLVINAIEAVPGRGSIEIAAERRGDTISVTVRDTGTGMDAATLARAYEPYFSTKDVGTGLGLPITRKIIEEHGGTIRIESRPGKGTTVFVELPAAGRAEAPAASGVPKSGNIPSS